MPPLLPSHWSGFVRRYRRFGLCRGSHRQDLEFQKGKITGTIIYTTSTVAATFGGKTYEGTLRIEGDQICTKYPKIKKGAETCFGISKTAKDTKQRTAQRSGHKRGRATAGPASARFG
ncbi:hypothetical protein L2449_23345 [Mesorhizobium muleiense]|uniref:hypothetical protein n=1 Tax=Mesorhizobium muleiense TaxID=1004279 RepID=UPI001F27F9F4|nr:hypothetical protein [Mesorhizobium muleiense]MCF6119775.1 hypothetical protein [Mesorhizobium muleiense]